MAKKEDNNWYVTATDVFWGSSDAPSKMVMVCPDLETARRWRDQWESRRDLRRVNICSRKPYYGRRVQCTYYDATKDGEKMYSVNDEVVTNNIASDIRRLGL